MFISSQAFPSLCHPRLIFDCCHFSSLQFERLPVALSHLPFSRVVQHLFEFYHFQNTTQCLMYGPQYEFARLHVRFRVGINFLLWILIFCGAYADSLVHFIGTVLLVWFMLDNWNSMSHWYIFGFFRYGRLLHISITSHQHLPVNKYASPILKFILNQSRAGGHRIYLHREGDVLQGIQLLKRS